METEYAKPLPTITLDSQPFWDGLKRHELMIQRCRNCGTYRHYPRPMCSKCHSFDSEFVKVSGKGKVYSWTVAHHPYDFRFSDEVPYAIVIAELDEGVRMMGTMVDTKPEELKFGMPVEVVFEDATDEITIPKFRRAK